MHVAATDDQALQDLAAAASAGPRSFSLALSREAESAIAEAGYYGRDEAQRRRVAALFSSGLRERIEQGQILIGSPATVSEQIRRIHEQVGAGM